MEIIFILLALYISFSLVMGIFSITQLNYQHRMTPIETFYKGIITFFIGFVGWLYLFPKGLSKNKYKVKAFHKIGNTDPFK